MTKRKGLFFSIALCALSLCLGFGFFVPASAASVNGWKNYENGKGVFVDEGGDTVITTAGNTAFGSSLALNETLVANVYGEYDFEFTLNANLTKGEEVWVSIVGIYETTTDENGKTTPSSVSRTGLHFTENDWMNVALYGNLGEADKGFSHVVDKNADFPLLTSAVNVKLSYRYDEDGHTVQTLYLNDKAIMTSDITELYGYYFVHTEAVGFDLYNNSEDVTISKIKVESSESEVNYRKTNINDFVYYGKENEFAAKRLTTSIDTDGEVFGFTLSEQLNAGMFANGKSHNYEAYAEINSVEGKSSDYEYGYYAWYKNVDNHVLLKTDGAKFYLTVTVDGQVVAEKSEACAAGAGDKFSFVKRSTSDGKTALSATLKGVTLELTDIDGIFENYYIGIYGKNVKVVYKGIKTVSFYVAYDFTEQGDWITSGSAQDAWNVDGKFPVVTLTDGFEGNTIDKISVAVTEKVINDPEATYEMTFDVSSLEGNSAFGIVPYYNSDADYVLAGVEKINGVYYLFVRSSKGENTTQAITATEGNTLKVVCDAEKFTVSLGEETLTANIGGVAAISEYYGFFAAGNGTATVTELKYDGFFSFAKYEENGWIKTSVEKDDIKFNADGSYTINGNYKEAGLTEGTDQQLAKIIKTEDYTNDYVIEVDLTKVGEPDGQCQRIGVLAWYLNDDNYIVLFVDQWTVWEAYQLNCCGIYNGQRMTDSSFNEYEWFLGFLDTPGYINQTFTLKVVKNGQTIKGYINGTMIFNKTFEDKYDLTVYEDDDLYLGMFSAGLEAKFENYTVRAMTDDEGTKTPSAGNRPQDKPTDPDNPGESVGGNESGSGDSSGSESTGNVPSDSGTSSSGEESGCSSCNSTCESMALCVTLGLAFVGLRKFKKKEKEN